MSHWLILFCILIYFLGLLAIGWFTARKANNDSYFTGNHASPWLVVAIGMIGDSLSGVTYISVPGAVYTNNFHYLQLVIGYFLGYYLISFVLLPLYYRLNLVSIYSYLGTRFGPNAQKTGSFFFLLSRVTGAAGRLFLAAGVIQLFVFDPMGVPFWLSTAGIIALMLVYTMKGGIKTLIWTDALQSGFLLAGVILSLFFISRELNYSVTDSLQAVMNDPLAKVWDWDINSRWFFPKQVLGGIFICVAMTGLDQNMMQKNLSCKSIGDAQKNLVSFSFLMLVVNLFFLSLGVMLYQYATTKGISLPLNDVGGIKTDAVFPFLALNHLGSLAALVFIIGLTAATFNSADSVLTTLTTSFYYDFLKKESLEKMSEKARVVLRKRIHISFAFVLLLVILLFDLLNSKAIIDSVLTLATYTYGPLLGLFSFGLIFKRKVKDFFVPMIAISSPLLCYLLDSHSKEWFHGYQFGYELLVINALITMLGLWIFSTKKQV
jgi:Na+/proline symporter